MPGIMDTLKRLSIAERERYSRKLKQIRAFRLKVGTVIRHVARSVVIALLWLVEALLVSYFVAMFQFVLTVFSLGDFWITFSWTLHCGLSALCALFLGGTLMPKKEVKQ